VRVNPAVEILDIVVQELGDRVVEGGAAFCRDDAPRAAQAAEHPLATFQLGVVVADPGELDLTASAA
jgi:hypothetical protein